MKILLALMLVVSPAYSADWFQCFNGLDSNPGDTPDRPVRTLEVAFELVGEGDNIYVCNDAPTPSPFPFSVQLSKPFRLHFPEINTQVPFPHTLTVAPMDLEIPIHVTVNSVGDVTVE